MPSWSVVFRFGTFLSIYMGESRGIFALGFHSSPCNCFSTLVIHSAFLLWSLRSQNFLQYCFASFTIGCQNDFVYSPQLAGGTFFFSLEMFYLVCIVWSYHKIFLVFLVLPISFYLSPVDVLFVLFIVLLFCFCPIIFLRHSSLFAFLLVIVDNKQIIIIIIYFMRVFHISFSWWSFTRVRLTANLKSSGLFSVFWPFSTML